MPSTGIVPRPRRRPGPMLGGGSRADVGGEARYRRTRRPCIDGGWMEGSQVQVVIVPGQMVQLQAPGTGSSEDVPIADFHIIEVR